MQVPFAELALLGLAAALAVAHAGLATAFQRLTVRHRVALAVLVATGTVLRGWVVPHTLLRGHYNSYRQVDMDLRVLEGLRVESPAIPAGHGVLVSILDAFVPVTIDRYFALGIAVGVVSIVAAFVALRLWTRDPVAALVGAAITALDPVQVRFSASEDPMVLVTLCDWLALAGLALAYRTGSRRGLLLTATALTFAVTAKPDAILGVAGLGAVALLAWPTAALPRDRRTAATVAAAVGWPSMVLAPFVYAALREPSYAHNAKYLAMPWASYLAYGTALPVGLVRHNPLLDPRYAAPAVAVLVLVGVLSAARRLDREALGWCVFISVVFVRVYLDNPLPFSETLPALGVKGDVRWNLHVAVPWTVLAVGGASWLLERIRTPVPRTALALLALATLWPTAGYWRHRWADQREADLVIRAARTLAPPCALVTAPTVPANGPVVRQALPLRLLALQDHRWTAVPYFTATPLPARVRSCAVYYRGLSCYVWQPDRAVPRDHPEQPVCASLFTGSTVSMVPVPGLVERFRYEDYSGLNVGARDVEIGFYRAAVPP